MSNGDESLEKKFERILGEDGIANSGDEAKEKDPNEPEEVISRREKRLRERVAQQQKEDDEIKNLNEYWYKDPNISVKIPKPDSPYEELENALLENRVTLETLKRTYCRSKKRNHQIITDAYLHEIKRYVLAIEGIKDILAARAEDYRIYYTDREHPTVACRRIILDCFVASNLYGSQAHQTNVLRLYRDVRLSKHPIGRLFVRVYYKFLGRFVSRLLDRFTFLKKPVHAIIDRVVAYVEKTL
ncbi:MAG: CFI-box-CTERM domain-containing protein [Rhodothermales bacterium]